MMPPFEGRSTRLTPDPRHKDVREGRKGGKRQKHSSAQLGTWQSLPECLVAVLANLPARQFQNLRLVCRDWRSATSNARKDLSPQRLEGAAKVFPHTVSLDCTRVGGKLHVKQFSGISAFAHLSSLRLENWRSPSCSALRKLAGLPLKQLILLGCHELKDCHLKTLSQVSKNVQELDLSQCDQITEAGLAHISRGLKHLHTLKLAECYRVDDSGIRHLSVCTSLTSLDISCTEIVGYWLAELPALQQLSAQWCESLASNCKPSLPGATSLTALDLSNGFIATAESTAVFQSLPLKRLNLSEAYLKESCDVLANLAAITSLESLILSDSIWYDGHASKLMAMTNLSELNLDGCEEVRETDLIGLSALTNLSCLHLSECSAASANNVCKSIAKLTQLRLLAMDGREAFSTGGLEQVVQLTGLVSLSLAWRPNLPLSVLATLTSLTHLAVPFATPDSRDCNLSVLTSLRSLAELNVSDFGGLVNSSGNQISKLRSLRTLYLDDSSCIEFSGCKAILKLPLLETVFCDGMTALTLRQCIYLKQKHRGIRFVAPRTEAQLNELLKCFDMAPGDARSQLGLNPFDF